MHNELDCGICLDLKTGCVYVSAFITPNSVPKYLIEHGSHKQAYNKEQKQDNNKVLS